jgi:hypothetical protein
MDTKTRRRWEENDADVVSGVFLFRRLTMLGEFDPAKG